jgi:hypothetical protein
MVAFSLRPIDPAAWRSLKGFSLRLGKRVGRNPARRHLKSARQDAILRSIRRRSARQGTL